MKKRGISDVVTTVLFILIIVVAVVGIWAFLLPALRQTGTATDTATATFTAPKVSIVPGSVSLDPVKSTVNFNVKRESGQGKIVALSTIVEDAYGNTRNYTQSYPSGINELEIKPVSIDYSGSGLGQIVGVSVGPVVQGSGSNQIVGVNVDSRDLTVDNVFSGLVAYWKFDESSYTGQGNEVKDQMGNHDGQALYGLTTVPGKLGNAGKFDGNKSQVLVSNPGTLRFDNDLTILAWINHADRSYLFSSVGNSQAQTIIVKTTNNGWDGKMLGLYPGDAPGWGIPQEYRFNSTLVYGAAGYGGTFVKREILPERWYYVAFTYNYASKNLILYVDGQKVASYHHNSTLPHVFDEPDAIGKLNVGSDWDWQSVKIGEIYDFPTTGSIYSYNYQGLIDDLMIFNRTLTSDEVAKIYSYYQ